MGRRTLLAYQFNRRGGRSDYVGQTASGSGSAQNPGRGFAESKLEVIMTIPASHEVRLSFGICAYMQFCASTSLDEANGAALGSITCLLSTEPNKISDLGRQQEESSS